MPTPHKARADALYVKLKTNSAFTVNREAVDAMTRHFDQDTTFVTHFALARLRDDIQSGRLNTATAVPVDVAGEWLSAAETEKARAHVERRFQPSGLAWKPDSPELAGALDQM